MSYARNLARLARTGIITVDTAQDLRDLTIYGGLRPESVQTLGANAKGDGGGGQWYWDGTDTTADNLGTVIKEAATVTGRWKRQYDKTIHVSWFGPAVGSANDATAALQAAFALLSTNKKIVFPPYAQYGITQPLVIDKDYVIIEGNESVITVNADVNGIEINPNATQDGLSARNHITVQGLNLTYGGTVGTSTAAGFMIRDVHWLRLQDCQRTQNFKYGIDVWHRDYSWIQRMHFFNCEIAVYMPNWAPTGTVPQICFHEGITVSAGTNSLKGVVIEHDFESFSFRECAFGGDLEACFDIVSGTAAATGQSQNLLIDFCSTEQQTTGHWFVNIRDTESQALFRPTITNCALQDANAGINLENARYANIFGNYFVCNGQPPLVIDDNCQFIYFEKNRLLPSTIPMLDYGNATSVFEETEGNRRKYNGGEIEYSKFLINRNRTPATTTGTTNQIIKSLALLQDSVRVGDTVRIVITGSTAGTAGNKVINVKFGDTGINQQVVSPTNFEGGWSAEFYLLFTALNAQTINWRSAYDANSKTDQYTASEDSSAGNISVVVSGQATTAPDSITVNSIEIMAV